MTDRKNISGTMNEHETLEAFIENAKKAASCMRELAKEHDDPLLAQNAHMLDDIRESGVQLSKMRSMSRLETMMAANIKTNKIIQ